MSGSPLYIDGKFAGALSYQLQRFETVRYAGFTPAADMAEVSSRIVQAPASQAPSLGATPLAESNSGQAFQAMTPMFALGGVSPRTAAIMTPQFQSLGLSVVALGGNSEGATPSNGGTPPTLEPGDAVSVALTTGDISLAGTGTVSRVDGNRITAGAVDDSCRVRLVEA